MDSKIKLVTFDNIDKLFNSFKIGKQSLEAFNNNNKQILDKDEWLEFMTNHNKKTNDLYQENVTLIDNILSPILDYSDQLSDEIYDYIYESTKLMYQEAYDFPFFLDRIGEILIKHYEKTNDLDKLMFSLQLYAYGNLEISRFHIKDAGKKSVETYKRILSYKDHLDDFKEDQSIIAFFVAYANIFRAQIFIGNMSVEETFVIFEQYQKFRESEAGRKYDEKIPRVKLLCEAFEKNYKTNSFHLYCEENGVGTDHLSPNFSLPFYLKIKKMCKDFLSSILNDNTHPLNKVSEIYCNYLQILAYEENLGWDEAFKFMTDFKKKHKYVINNDTEYDPVGLFINPLERIIEALYKSSKHIIDKEMLALSYYNEINDFSKAKDYNEYLSFSVDSSLEHLCFSTDLFKCFRSLYEKEKFIINLIINRHPTTYKHSLMVQEISLKLLDQIFIDCPEELEGIYELQEGQSILDIKDLIIEYTKKASLFHDIGKNAIIGIINCDYRALSIGEYEAIENHPKLGIKYLSLDPELNQYYDVIMGHHKSYDGKSGYPADFDNTKSKYKPIIDLITIADCLDSATDELSRNYKDAKSLDEVIEELKQESGTIYNPKYVKLFDNEVLKAGVNYLLTEQRKNAYFTVYKQG